MRHLAALFDLLDRIGAGMDAFARGTRGTVQARFSSEPPYSSSREKRLPP